MDAIKSLDGTQEVKRIERWAGRRKPARPAQTVYMNAWIPVIQRPMMRL